MGNVGAGESHSAAEALRNLGFYNVSGAAKDWGSTLVDRYLVAARRVSADKGAFHIAMDAKLIGVLAEDTESFICYNATQKLDYFMFPQASGDAMYQEFSAFIFEDGK